MPSWRRVLWVTVFCPPMYNSGRNGEPFSVNNWNAAAVIVSSISALISLAALFWNLRWSHLTTSVNLVLDLDDRFNNKLKSSRKMASAKLLEGDSEPDELDTILDFLDTLGYLTKMKVVNKDFVWETFQYWIVGY